MTVQEYLRVFRERWLVLAIAAVLGLGVGLGTYLIRPTHYTAQLSMYVSAQLGADPSQAPLDAQLVQQRVTSYTGLVTSPRVMAETVRRLDLPETPGELAGTVSASSPPESAVVNVSVTRRNPEQAAAVANTVGSVFTGLVGELERPSSPDATTPTVIRVVQPADVPQSPSSTGLPLSLAVGLFAGLVVGAGLVLVGNAVDDAVRSPRDLAAVTGAPTLGVIEDDADVPRVPLRVGADPQEPPREAFRRLRTNLQHVDRGPPRKVIMVTSSTPAEGRSTTVVDLALAFAAAGSSVLVVDADLRRPVLADVLGLDRTVGLTGVLAGQVRFERAVQSWGGGAVDVLVGGPPLRIASELLGGRRMRALIEEVRASYDVVLLDSPPLLPVTDAAALAPATDGVVVVCRHGSTSRSQVTSAVEALRTVSVEPLGTVLTMVPPSRSRARARYTAHDEVGEAPSGPAVATSFVRPSATTDEATRVDPGTGAAGRVDDGRVGPSTHRPR